MVRQEILISKYYYQLYQGVYIKDGDDTNWTLGSFWTQTTKQVPTERKQEEHKERHHSSEKLT